ncbi:uncharacterized protein LOC123652187 [Pipistrellus kuhlii]|uniref:Uncharacterized protein n=1 Tax=Pipistrellus kuhlii TaxID=59472 RepID=A0A7J8B2E1_PIPKU|nr:uncharacterized protein LOC123652187 [Pipistrellus kuhlii]KAF6392679.1 hypothetical protein mPipKuh1_007862 [Pipistrellus kuhlii]
MFDKSSRLKNTQNHRILHQGHFVGLRGCLVAPQWNSPAGLRRRQWQQRLIMALCVSLLVFLHGVLTLQMKGAFGLSDESSDSSPGHRKGYYVFQLLPIQRLKEKRENAFDRKAADLLALWTSSVFGFPDRIRTTVNTEASFQLPPAPVIPRQSPPTLTVPVLGSTALRGPVLTPATQSKGLESNGETSVSGNLGNYFGMSARLPLIPQVLTTPALPTTGAPHSTSFPTSPTTKEPRGDM